MVRCAEKVRKEIEKGRVGRECGFRILLSVAGKRGSVEDDTRSIRYMKGELPL